MKHLWSAGAQSVLKEGMSSYSKIPQRNAQGRELLLLLLLWKLYRKDFIPSSLFRFDAPSCIAKK